jgi:hypothetical protein
VCAATLAAGIWSFRFGAPEGYSPLNTYNIIFLKLLPSSKDLPGELSELGLDTSYSPFVGTFAYWPDSPMQKPEFVKEFARRTSPARVALFYLRHPARAWRVLHEALDEAGRIRPPLGNFDRSTGLPEKTETQAFTFSSGIKRAVLEGHGSRYLVLFLLLASVLVVLSPDRAGALCLAAMGLTSMLVAGFGDAVDHARHFSLFHVVVDVMIVTIAACAARRWPSSASVFQSARHSSHASPAR